MRRITERWWIVGMALVLAVLVSTGALISTEQTHHTQQRLAKQRDAVVTLKHSVADVLGRETELARIIGVSGSAIGSHWPVLAQTVMSQPLANSTGFVVPVPGRDRAAFERQSGLMLVQYIRPGVTRPAPRRPEYLVVEHISQRAKAPTLGIDLSTNPVRRRLLLGSAATREPEASAPLALISAAGARGVAVFAPVFTPNGGLRGWVTATYEARGLAAMVTQRDPGVSLTIWDGQAPLLGDQQRPSGRPTTLVAAGQTWDVWTSVSSPGVDPVPWLVLCLGLGLAVGVMLILREAVVRERYASAQVARHIASESVRQAELASERRALAEAQSIAHIGSWSIDLETGHVEWSEEMYRIFARDPQDGPLKDTAFLDRLHRDDRRRIRAEFGQALQAGGEFDLRARLLDPAGGVRHVRALARRATGEQLRGTIQDVTAASELREQLAMTSARLQAVLDHSPMGIYMRDLDGRFIVANQELAGIQGTSANELLGRTLDDVLDPDAAAEVRASDASIIAGKSVVRYEDIAPAAAGDGDARRFLWQKFPVFDADGAPLGVGGIAMDMTERIAIETSLAEANEQFRGAFDEAPIGMAIIDLDGRLTQVNDALCAMLGYAPNDLEGMMARDVSHPDDNVESQAATKAMLAGHRSSYTGEKRYMTATGETVSCALQATVLTSSDGQPRAILAQIQDITDRKRHQAELEHLADHDALTGLLNRRAFTRELTSHAERAARYGATGAILMLDLDQFKFVNDTQGHHAGDQLITRVAHLVGERLRKSDVLARLGGDEFAVLLPQAGTADAERVAQGLLEALRETPIAIGGTQRQITASIGVACFTRTSVGGDDIMINADRAMYDAKANGRDRYELFSSDAEVSTRAEGRFSWVQRITDALAHDGFTLLAQPVLDLQSRTTSRYELLLRMHDGDGGLIPPASFLLTAERLGLMGDIDAWVSTQAITMLAAQPEITLEVNLSARSLGDPGLLEVIAHELHVQQVAPERLIFEVSEADALVSIPRTQTFGEQLAQLGCGFALDSFGVGPSSFSHLKYLVFDSVKIDGELIRDCSTNEADRLIIRAIVDVTRGLGKQTSAAWVRDDATVELLASLGVDYGQGFHLGMPAPLPQPLLLDPDHSIGLSA